MGWVIFMVIPGYLFILDVGIFFIENNISLYSSGKDNQ